MNIERTRKKILKNLSKYTDGKPLIDFLRKYHINPLIIDGDIRYQAPATLIDQALKSALLPYETMLFETLSKNKFHTKKPGFHSPDYCTKDEMQDILKKYPTFNRYLSEWTLTNYDQWHDQKQQKTSTAFCHHQGDLKVDGRFISFGGVFIIIGDLHVTGNINTYANGFDENYLFVTGNVYCKNLATCRNSIVVIAGDLIVEETLLAYDMDMHLEVYGNVKAKYIISGYTTWLSFHGALTCALLFGYAMQLTANKDKYIVSNFGKKLLQKTEKASPKKKADDEALKQIELKDIYAMNIFISEVFEKDEYDDSDQWVLSEDMVAQYLMTDNEILKAAN